MKKLTALLLCAAMVCAMLTGCKKENTAPAESSSPAATDPADMRSPEGDASQSAEPESSAAAVVEAPDVNAEGAYLMLDAYDAYDGAYCFEAEQKGQYFFEAYNAAGYEDLTWSVAVLDERLDEDETAKLWESSSYDLTGDGSVMVQAGQYVYCVCSLNASNTEKAVPGASILLVQLTAAEAEPEESTAVKQLTIDAAEAYISGAYFFQAAETGTYKAVSITTEGFSPSDVGCEADAVQWTFYVLDEEFEEPARFLPQAYASALEGDGTFQVKKGQYVYCTVNVNDFTADEMPEGMNTLTLTLQ